jgi:hypothetical protein
MSLRITKILIKALMDVARDVHRVFRLVTCT